MKTDESFLKQALSNRAERGLLRKLQKYKTSIDFQSNDYLGLSQSQMIHQKTNEILSQFPAANGSGGSRLISGNSELAETAEIFVAKFFGVDSSLIYSSGYTANLGLMSCIAKKNDTILYDELCHASIRDGIRLSMAKSYSFRHNDLEDMVRLAQKASGKVFVVTESVFSMDGDSAPLLELSEKSQKYGLYLIVDEAHSTGIFPWPPIHSFARIVTFGKACGVHGAAIVGSEDLKNFLINFSRPFIYSTAPAPHFYASIMASLKNLENCEEQRQKLFENIRYFKSICHHSGLLESKSPIQSIVIPLNKGLNEMAQKLVLSGIQAKAILSPTVPAGKERFRICLHSYNTPEEIDLLAQILNNDEA